MRKHYLDNIRWMTVVAVVIYHIFYMYNGQGIPGVAGKITDLDVQYYDVIQYIIYPWIMILLFMVSGISSRLYLEKHTGKEFIRSRTTKLLVPCTVGLVAFQFIQGYVNASLSSAFSSNQGAPLFVKVIICILSGIGVLWYIQMLWLFSQALALIHKIDKDRLWKLCGRLGGKFGIVIIIALAAAVWAAGQIFNTPLIVCYRFGLYFFVFLLGYFVFSHDEVVEVLKRWFFVLAAVSAILCVVFCVVFFGYNYADNPVYKSPFFLLYGYFASLAIIGGMARFGDVSNRFTEWMSKRSYGLYIFHYLGISSVALFLARPGIVPPVAAYLLSAVAGFGGAYILKAIISRIPFWRWAVLGISKKTVKKETKEVRNVQG
ncbi:MAG: acyltransferase [Clostridiales bacterium]|nr:acyltransferase [Clostridiales bacterium]